MKIKLCQRKTCAGYTSFSVCVGLQMKGACEEEKP